MTFSQTFVVASLQFALASAALLLAARTALRWIKQPVERIRLIQLTLATVLAIPVFLVAAPWPVWRLDVLAEAAKSAPAPLSEQPATASLTRQPLDEEPPGPAVADAIATEQFLADAAMAVDRLPISETSAQGRALPIAAGRALAGWNVWSIAAWAIALLHGLALVYFLFEWRVGSMRLQQLVLSATAAPLPVQTAWNTVTGGCGNQVNVLVSPAADTPLTFGWLRPVVVIPQHIAEGDPATLRFCLAHEWSHIQRADILSWQALWACQFLLWYQPAFWKLRRELRVCQDILADAGATARGDDAIEYSELLVRFARNRQAPTMTPALTFLDHPNQLMRRVAMLLTRPFALRTECTWKFSLAAGLVALLVCGVTTAVRLDAARADDKQPPRESKQQAKPAAETENAAAKPADEAAKPAAANKEPGKETPEAAAPEHQPAHLTYHCVVVDKDSRQGVANAKVTVERLDSRDRNWPLKQVAKSDHVTDAEGKFTIEIPPEQSGKDWLYIQVYVEHDDYVRIPGLGYSLSMIRKNETVGERPFFENLQLQPADRVTAKVVSPAGEPLAGVKIFGFTSPKVRELNNIRWLDAKTAADGTFRVNVMKGGVGVFWVMPDDYSIVQKFVSDQPGDLGEIRVPDGIRIRGRTLTADGQPAPGVAVNAYYQGMDDEPLRQYSVLSGIRRGAITDAQGRFTIDPLPAGEYRVVPEDQLGDPRRERDVHPLPGVFIGQKIALKEGAAAAEIELQAVPHVLFHGQYVTSKGEKTKGHEYWIAGRMDGQHWSSRVRPDESGSVVAKVPHGLQDVQVMLSTNEHSALRVRPGAGKPLENDYRNVHLGTLTDDVEGFEIIRYKAPLALIKAVDTEGRPVRHFRVTAKYPWGRQIYVLEGEQRSDLSFERQNDGRVRTSQMLPDEEVTFTATAAGYQPASETLKLAEGETKEVVITLKPVSAAVDAINSAVDGAAQLIDKIKPSAPAKQE